MAEKETKNETEAVAKVITPDERKRLLLEAIKKTVAPAFISVFFALLFYFQFGDARNVSWFSVFLVVLLIAFYLQRFLYPAIGVRVAEFGAKDWFYVELLVMIYFWVFWTLLLN